MNGADGDQTRQARAWALRAHAEQLDRAGRPYREHLKRVAARATDDNTRAVAWLHDTVEDTTTTLDGLRNAGFSEAVVEAVRVLTRPGSGRCQDYIDSVSNSGNPTAVSVKIADLRDHLSSTESPS